MSSNGHVDVEDTGPPPHGEVAGVLDTAEAKRLAELAEAFDDLQYVLLCCENLISAMTAPGAPARGPGQDALVEALWTGALVGYARCFSPRSSALADDDVAELDLEGEVREFHEAMKKLRDHYVSRHANPRESVTVGVVLDAESRPEGIAVLSDPRPQVDDATVRQLGRIAYALSGLVDLRIGTLQVDVMTSASDLAPDALSRLPQVRLPQVSTQESGPAAGS